MTNEEQHIKNEVIATYLNLPAYDTIPSACKEKLFTCPNCKQSKAINELAICDWTDSYKIMNSQIVCIECSLKSATKYITKERFIELLQKLSDIEFNDLCDGITDHTFEYGWLLTLGKSELITTLWKNFMNK